MSTLRLYLRLVGASIRAQMQYRAAFAVRSVADFFVVIADFVPIYFLVRKFGMLDGWSIAELALLYGMVASSWAVVECALYGFEIFGTHLIQGEMDRWLLRPHSVILQVAAHRFELRKLGRIAQAAVVLGVAVFALGLGTAELAWVLTGVVGGIAFFAAVVILGAASQFWTLGETAELQNMLTYGGSATLSYPVSIYEQWFRRVVTYGIPLAFVNYFPALAALHRTASAGWPPFVPYLAPVICGTGLWLAQVAFDRGLMRYESTGS